MPKYIQIAPYFCWEERRNVILAILRLTGVPGIYNGGRKYKVFKNNIP